jgi:hypothetical protein
VEVISTTGEKVAAPAGFCVGDLWLQVAQFLQDYESVLDPAAVDIIAGQAQVGETRDEKQGEAR